MQVKLIKQGKSKIELIKLIRWLTSLSLKECNDIVTNIPSVFEIKDENLEFEQIEKNFSSIGALIEIEEPKKPDTPVGGASIVEEVEEPAIIKNTTEKKEESKESFLESINKKAETYALVRGIKTSLIISAIGAFMYSFSGIYFNYYYGYIIIFAVAVANAIILKRETDKENTNIAKIAAGMTFFFYMATSFFKKIVILYLYNYAIGFDGFLYGIFNLNTAVILIAMGVSYFLVAKKSPIDAIVNASKKSSSYKTKNKQFTSYDKGDQYTKKTKTKRKKKKF